MQSVEGRPRVLDETKRREVCAIVGSGVGMKGAADYVGCRVSTIYREMQRDREFAHQVRLARLAIETQLVQNIRHAAQRNWRAAAWLLEREKPERYDAQGRVHSSEKEVERLLTRLADTLLEEMGPGHALDRVLSRLDRVVGKKHSVALSPGPPLLPSPKSVDESGEPGAT